VNKKQELKYTKLFGEHVKAIRESLGLSQEDLAGRVGNVSQNISRLECGRINPTLLQLEKYAAGLDMSVSDLLLGFEEFKKG